MSDKEDLVPLEQVLDDMYDPDGGIPAIAAREYYYEHYASEAERRMMDAEDKANQRFAIGFMAFVGILAVGSIVAGILGII